MTQTVANLVFPIVLPTLEAGVQPHVGGKFIFVGDDKLYIRGVTYGAFRPDGDGNEFHDLGRQQKNPFTSTQQPKAGLFQVSSH